MCGRACLSSDVGEIKVAFRIAPERPTPNIAPSWDLAPTDPQPAVRYDAKKGRAAQPRCDALGAGANLDRVEDRREQARH